MRPLLEYNASHTINTPKILARLINILKPQLGISLSCPTVSSELSEFTIWNTVGMQSLSKFCRIVDKSSKGLTLPRREVLEHFAFKIP